MDAMRKSEVAAVNRPVTLYGEEPFDSSSSLVPAHLKRNVVASNPVLEVLQRLLFRLRTQYRLDNLVALLALYDIAEPVYRYVKDWIVRLFSSEIIISEHDPVAKEVLSWMAANVMKDAISTQAIVSSSNNSIHISFAERCMQDLELSLGPPRRVLNTSRSDVDFTPPIGKKLFWIGYRPFVFSRSVPGQMRTFSTRHETYEQAVINNIVVTTPGWSLKPLQYFIALCHRHKLENKGRTINVYFANGTTSHYSGGPWSAVEKSIRNLDTVDIDDVVKADLIRDAEEYFSPAGNKFYTECGIPYRRGWLFYGPPGTGKTSFSSALAGHLGCDIYMINLASDGMSDSMIQRLFFSLPRKCVVVVEDIDCAGIDEARPVDEKPKPIPIGRTSQRITLTKPSPRVTLSGLLNAIDGNAAQEGRLLIMTSNDPNSLDEALKRPGRIDRMQLFGKMKAKSSYDIFKRLIGRVALAAGTTNAEELERHAQAFSKKLPEDTFTPAEIQNFLQSCRGDANKALAEIDGWVGAQLKPGDTSPSTASDVRKGTSPLVDGQSNLSTHTPGSLTDTSLAGTDFSGSMEDVEVIPLKDLFGSTAVEIAAFRSELLGIDGSGTP